MAPNEPMLTAGQTPAIDPGTGHARDLEGRVVAQAMQDPAFRARVVAEPKAVFAEMGLHIPAEVQIQVMQETAEQYYLVLPAMERMDGGGTSLSDADLEAVAGGTLPHTYSTCNVAWTGCASGGSGCSVTVSDSGWC